MSVAANVDLVIDQASDFVVQMYWTDYNSVPFSVVSPMRMQIRAQTGQLAAELVYLDTPLAGEQQTIIFDASSGLIQLQLTSDKTNLIPPGIYDYDLFVTYQDKFSSQSVRQIKLLFGTVEVRGKVTQNV
jgi:hypothetical protein